MNSDAIHSFVTKAVAEAIGKKVERGYTLVVTLADGSIIKTADAVHLSLGV